jgi:hypothetical protein
MLRQIKYNQYHRIWQILKKIILSWFFYGDYKDFRVLSAFDGSAGGSLMYILLTDSCNWCDALMNEFSKHNKAQ